MPCSLQTWTMINGCKNADNQGLCEKSCSLHITIRLYSSLVNCKAAKLVSCKNKWILDLSSGTNKRNWPLTWQSYKLGLCKVIDKGWADVRIYPNIINQLAIEPWHVATGGKQDPCSSLVESQITKGNGCCIAHLKKFIYCTFASWSTHTSLVFQEV